VDGRAKPGQDDKRLEPATEKQPPLLPRSALRFRGNDGSM
jgi:hypothetical protein